MFKVFKRFLKIVKTNSRKLFWIVPLISLILAAAFLYGFKDRFLVALVNNQPITRAALDRELEKQGGATTLENLVLKTLLFQEGKKKKINISPSEIENKIQELEKELTTQGQNLESLLAMRGQTRADLVEQIKIQLIVEQLLAGKTQATEEEMKKYFEENKTYYPKGTTFESKKAEIEQTLIQQKMGEEFQVFVENLKKQAKIVYFLQF